MQKLKKIFITITLIILILTSFGSNNVFATNNVKASSLTAKQTAVAYSVINAARQYMLAYGAETVYDHAEDGNDAMYKRRANTIFYRQKSNGPKGMHYYLECTSFVLIAFRDGMNIQSQYPQFYNDRTGKYMGMYPAKVNDQIDPPFKKVEGGINALEVGDVVMNDHHVMLYTGSGMVIHCDGNGRGQGSGAISWETLDSYASSVGENKNTYNVYRLSDESADNVTDEDMAQKPLDQLIQAINKWRYKKIPFRRVDESSIDKDKTFEYQGIAKAESQTGSKEEVDDSIGGFLGGIFDGVSEGVNNAISAVEEWKNSVLSDLLNWLISFVFTTIKSVIVGMTTILQIVVTNWVDAASGEDISSRLDNGMMAYLENGLRQDVENALTMEKIVYNKVPILDINVFNGTQAGGETVSSSSLVVLLRNLVATFYTIIRRIALIGLLLSLIYLGIQLVITTSAEKKAEYKKKLVGWGIAFFIVFGMHYFLVGIMAINEITVGILSNIGMNIASSLTGGGYHDLALAMRDLTYSSEISKSAIAVLMYLVMIYYLLKFLVIYFKRLFVTSILIILGPFMGIKYALDRIRFNKSASLSTWGKEYIFSVGTQTIHALIYTIFVSISYNMVLASDTGKIATCILACLFFRFMTTAEKLLRNTLKLVGKQSESIMGDLDSTNIKDLFGYALLARIQMFNKKEYVPGVVKRRYQASKGSLKESLAEEYVRIRRKEYIDKYEDAYAFKQNGTVKKAPGNIDKQIDDVLKEEFEHKLSNIFGDLSKGQKLIGGMIAVPVGLTMAAVGPFMLGSLKVYAGGKTLQGLLSGAITGYKSSSQIETLRAKNGTYKKLRKWAELNGTKEISKTLKEDYLNKKDDVTAKHELKVATLHQARKVEIEIEEEIAEKKLTILKGTEPNATRLEKELAKKYTRELTKNVEDAMKTVDKKDIQEHVKKYMKKTGKYALAYEDYKNIAEQLDVRVTGEIIDDKLQTDELVENIKLETVARFIKEVSELDKIDLDSLEDKVKDELNVAQQDEEKQSLKLTLECIEDKRKEMEGKAEMQVYNNLSKEDQEKVNQKLREIIPDTEIEKQTKTLNIEKIIETMKKAVDRKGSIKKEVVTKEFKPLIEKVEKIRELDEIVREDGDKPLHKSVPELIATMINNTKIKKKQPGTKK